MIIVDYARTSGQELTYCIRADDKGRFSVHLDGREMLRGHDPLSAQGRRAPNKRKAVGALAEAKLSIETLRGMQES